MDRLFSICIQSTSEQSAFTKVPKAMAWLPGWMRWLIQQLPGFVVDGPEKKSAAKSGRKTWHWQWFLWKKFKKTSFKHVLQRKIISIQLFLWIVASYEFLSRNRLQGSQVHQLQLKPSWVDIMDINMIVLSQKNEWQTMQMLTMPSLLIFKYVVYMFIYYIHQYNIYIYICTPFPRVWTERRLFTSHSWESNALLSPRGGNTLRRKKCWCWCCVGDDGDNEEDDDDEDEDEEDDDDNDNDDFHDDFHDDEDAEGQEELNTIGCVPLQRFHPCFENPSHADEGANSAVSLVAKSISRWGWSVYLWQVYHNQSFTSAKMLKNVWWCMQKLWLTVNPYKSWGPRSLAKLIYNSNNYGLWYL